MTTGGPSGGSRLGQKMFFGVSVALSSYVVTRGLNLIVTVALARVLAQEGMGLVAAALLLVEFIDAWRDFGLRDALIYEPSPDPVIPATAFAMILGIATFQALAMLALAPFAPLIIEDESIVAVLIWFALLFPINAFGSVPEAMLQKRLQFVRRGVADVLAAALKLAVTISLLMNDFGVWSMVWGILAAAVARTALLILFASWMPRALPSWSKVGHLVRYGKHIVFGSIVSPLRERLDQFAIAITMGDAQLGLYFVAARIPEVLIVGSNSIITRVVFPAFVTIADDPAQLGRAYLATTKWCLILIAPLAAGLAATASQTVPLVFGPGWDNAIPILICLALTGIPVTIGWSSVDVFKATGRPHLYSYLVVIEIIVSAPLVWTAALMTRDLLFVALAMFASEVASTYFRLLFMRRFAEVDIVRTLRAISPPLVAAAIMGGAVSWFGGMGVLAPGWERILASVLLGVAVYLAVLIAMDRRGLIEGYQQIRRRSSER